MKKLAVLFTAIALVCFAVPAMAVDWNFYGSARMATFWTSNDFDESELRQGDAPLTEDSQLDWALQGNSRFGATVKHESVSGRFELGLKSSSTGDVDVGTRRIFGSWNFGAGSLKVGKDYSPISQFISGQVYDGDLGLLGIGTMYGARVPQIALSFGGFEIALIEAQTPQLTSYEVQGRNTSLTDSFGDYWDSTAASGVSLAAIETLKKAEIANLPDSPTNAQWDTFFDGTGGATIGSAILLNSFTSTFESNLPADSTGDNDGDPDQVFPKIEAKWGMGFDTWNFNIRGGFQYYSIEEVESVTGTGENDIDVTSWIIGGDVGWNFGPGYLKGSLSYGVNVGNAGWAVPNSTSAAGKATWDGDDDVNDVNTAMAALVAGIKVSDMMSFEGGFGIRQDDPKDNPSGFDEKQTPWSAYVQGVFTLAPGVYLIPEIGYFDWDKDFTDADAGSTWYAGGKWQIDF
jgi:hypothetical protein